MNNAKDRGKLILLNGTPSSGKTTLVRNLAKVLHGNYEIVPPCPYVLDAADDVTLHQPHVIQKIVLETLRTYYLDLIGVPWSDPIYQSVLNLVREEYALLWQKTTQNMIDYIIDAVSHGRNLVAEGRFSDVGEFELVVKKLHDFDTLFVGVDCLMETLNARDSIKEGRPKGWAIAHHASIHKYRDQEKFYDIRIDTSNSTVQSCIETISKFIDSKKTCGAMKNNFEMIKEDRDKQEQTKAVAKKKLIQCDV